MDKNEDAVWTWHFQACRGLILGYQSDGNYCLEKESII